MYKWVHLLIFSLKGVSQNENDDDEDYNEIYYYISGIFKIVLCGITGTWWICLRALVFIGRKTLSIIKWLNILQ